MCALDMSLLRSTFSTIGRRAGLLADLRAVFALAPAQSPACLQIHRESKSSDRQTLCELTDADRTILGLHPPWQIDDLSEKVQRAFMRHGPAYLEHLSIAWQERARNATARRAAIAAEYERAYGSDWYAMLKEAQAIKDQEKQERIRIATEGNTGARAKKAKLAEVNLKYEEKGVKQARLRAAMMDVVARRRGSA